MLNPAYLAEALGQRKEKDKGGEGEERSGQKRRGEDLVNLKLKQSYEARTQIKPFYSGGKIVVIDDEEFICQHGPSVKVIRKSKSIKEEEQNEEEEEKMEVSFIVANTIEAELDDVLSFDACPISKVVITAHKSNLLRIWCLMTGELIRTIKSLHHLPIGYVEICSHQTVTDMKEVLQSSIQDEATAIDMIRMKLCWVTVSSASVKLWQIGGNQMSKLLRVDNITSLGYVRWHKTRFYGAERNIYVMGIDGETKQFGILKTLEGHYSQVTGIEFDVDNLMLSGGRDKVVILWDMANNYNKLKTVPFPETIEGLYLAEQHNLFVAVNPSNVLHFNVKEHKVSKRPVITLNETETITGFYRSPHPDLLKVENCLISSHTGTIYEVVKTKDESDKKATLNITHQYVGDLDEILCTVLWTDNKVAVANNTTVIKVYDMSSGSCDFLRGHKDIVLSLSSKNDMLVSASKDNQIMFWKSSSLEPCAVLSGHLASVTGICFNPVKNEVYSVSEDKFLKAWDQQRLLKGVVAHDKQINAVHCSPNGALVATASRDKTAKVWDSETLQLIATFKGHKKGVWDAKFSSWDQLVVTASADTTIKIWNLTTYDCLQTLQGHLSSVLQVQFINHGLQVLSVSSDGSMKSWELKTSSCLLTEECGNDKIWAFDASPDGSTVVTGSADSVLTLWRDITEEKVIQTMEKRKKLIEDEQKLNNLLNAHNWTEAFGLALRLDRPLTLLKVVREVPDVVQFIPVIEKLEEDHLLNLINYITKWNTNTKTSTEAQTLLNTIIRCFPEEHISRFVQPMQMLPYTEKHHERFYRMMRQMTFLSFLANENGTADIDS